MSTAQVDLQQLLDAGAGRSVSVPAGRYPITRPLAVRSGTTVVLEDGAVIAVEADCHAFVNADPRRGDADITISGGEIDGGKADRTPASNCRGIYLVRVDRPRVLGTFVHDTKDHGIHLTECAGWVIEACRVERPGDPGATGGSCLAVSLLTGRAAGGRIAGNTLRDAYRAGLKVGCQIEGVHDAGLTVTGNACEGNGAPGIGSGMVFQGKSGRARHTLAGVTITGNTCWANNPTGIRLTGCEGFTVTGNTCSRNAGDGILLQGGSRDNQVSGNVCDDNSAGSPGARDGIRLGDRGEAVVGNLVTGNRCSGAWQRFGIAEQRPADRNQVIGNTLTGNATGGTWQSGRASIFRDNDGGS
ncbi:MAG: right-handed parallel beta-helix repeat-containing protein [Actinomycetota bacterium]